MSAEEQLRGPSGATGATGAAGPPGPPGPSGNSAAAQAGAEAGAGAGAATGAEAGAAAGTAHAEAAGEVYMTAGARRATRRMAWSLIVLFIFVIGVGAANLLFTSSQVRTVRTLAQSQAEIIARQQQQIQADCGVDRDLGGLPLTNLANGHPSELGVKIVSDFRGAWHHKGCPGALPPPNPTFVRGAAFYHLPVN